MCSPEQVSDSNGRRTGQREKSDCDTSAMEDSVHPVSGPEAEMALLTGPR